MSLRVSCLSILSLPLVYHALFLEELTVVELKDKMAVLFSVPFRQLRHVYKQGPTGIHVLVTDEVRAHGSPPLREGMAPARVWRTSGPHLALILSGPV